MTDIDFLPYQGETCGKLGMGSDEHMKLKNKLNRTRVAIEELEGRIAQIHREMGQLDNPQNTTLIFKKGVLQKRDRKKFESDAQQLANRIELLKKEELKIWKKIEEYHRKANEIYDLKSKNKERQNEKIENTRKNNKFEGLKELGSANMRKRREETKKLRTELLERDKKACFDRIKSEQKLNERKYHKIKAKTEQEKRQMTDETKLQHSLGRLRLYKHEEGKQNKIVRRIQKEENCEKQVIGKIKKELNSMCKMEGDWITKLKSSQVIQTQAFEKLKNVLILTTDDFNNKYSGSGGGNEPGEDEQVEGQELEENGDISEDDNGDLGDEHKGLNDIEDDEDSVDSDKE